MDDKKIIGINVEELNIKKENNPAFDPVLNNTVTVVGMQHYYGSSFIDRGAILMCEKEFDNENDPEAIMVMLPVIGKIGYIANNTFTVMRGTQSAGRVYDKVGDRFFINVLFVDGNKAIAKINEGNFEELEKQWTELFMNPEITFDKK